MLKYFFTDSVKFWRLNAKKVLAIFLSYLAFMLGLFFVDAPNHIVPYDVVIGFSLFSLAIMSVGFYVPGINAFMVVRQLIEDTTNNSIMPLFDSGYTVGLIDEKSWIFFAKPCIKGTIGGLPVSVSYTRSDRSSWSHIDFIFSPLSKQGSRRIYSSIIFFELRLKKRLQKDVKPEVLKCVAKAKADGLTSGEGRPISMKHYDAYEA